LHAWNSTNVPCVPLVLISTGCEFEQGLTLLDLIMRRCYRVPQPTWRISWLSRLVAKVNFGRIAWICYLQRLGVDVDATIQLPSANCRSRTSKPLELDSIEVILVFVEHANSIKAFSKSLDRFWESRDPTLTLDFLRKLRTLW